jgi:hypothetical protein
VVWTWGGSRGSEDFAADLEVMVALMLGMRLD